MAKTRNCRYTEEERAVHAEAVRLRKMTDKQLVELLRGAKRPAPPAGGKDKLDVLLTALANGECKGIKGATAYKIQMFAQEKGLTG